MHARGPKGHRDAGGAPSRVGRAARRLGDRATRTLLLVSIAHAATAERLRVLAYHDVPDRDTFVAQLRHLLRRYRVVGGDDVAAALAGAPLPPHALWLTFDDGHPTVLDVADVMADHGVQAAMFVCPGVLDSREPLWWQVLEAAAAVGGAAARDLPAATDLKRLPDAERRAAVTAVVARLTAQEPGALGRRQLTTGDCHGWRALGHEIGNHTWDHPCLDMCSAAEQRRQVTDAHEALVARGLAPRYLALPNGNRAAAAEDEALRLGYAATVLFDHRLAVPRPGRPLSRLRLDAEAPVSRARAVASGAHPWLAHRAGVLG